MASKGWEQVTMADVIEKVARKGQKAVRGPIGQAVGVRPRGKYGAVKTTVSGITFDSRKEAARYVELKALEAAGEVSFIVLQPRFPIEVFSQTQIREIQAGGTPEPIVVAEYVADFSYYDKANDRIVIEDVKSPATAKKEVYRLKKKLVEALYQIRIREI